MRCKYIDQCLTTLTRPTPLVVTRGRVTPTVGSECPLTEDAVRIWTDDEVGVATTDLVMLCSGTGILRVSAVNALDGNLGGSDGLNTNGCPGYSRHNELNIASSHCNLVGTNVPLPENAETPVRLFAADAGGESGRPGPCVTVATPVDGWSIENRKVGSGRPLRDSPVVTTGVTERVLEIDEQSRDPAPTSCRLLEFTSDGGSGGPDVIAASFRAATPQDTWESARDSRRA